MRCNHRRRYLGRPRDELLSPQELARRLDVPVTTLYGWRYKGVGPRGRRVGKHVRYWWSDVLQWLDDEVGR